MKKYIINIDFKFLTQKIVRFSLITLLCSGAAQAQSIRFTDLEKTIITSVIGRFKKECGHISSLDQVKLKDIQKKYENLKSKMTAEQKNCHEQFLSQLVGAYNIYRQSCDEITPKSTFGTDEDLARIFVSVRRYENGIRLYHERLNECLIRRAATKEMFVPYTDYELNNRILSKKVREIDLSTPFKENGVDFR